MSTIKSSSEHLTLNADGASKDLKLQTNGTERAIVKADGNVGIGTSSPTASRKLHISGTAQKNAKFERTGSATSQVEFVDSTSVNPPSIGSVGDNYTIETSNTERMRIDSSGNVGIGTTTPAVPLEVKGGASSNWNAHFESTNSTGWGTKIMGGADSGDYSLLVKNYADTALFQVRGNGEVQIGSGNNISNSLYVEGNEPAITFKLANATSSNKTLVNLYAGSTWAGAIQVNTTGTTNYNTGSDYRLKENVVPMTGSIDRLKELKPSRFNFIAAPDITVDGFLAHEAQEVVPEAVGGEKDAMRTEEYEVEPAVEATYDDDGNELTPAVEAVMGEREVPDYQGIDQAKLVPLLTSALQEAVAKIEALEARVEALENA